MGLPFSQTSPANYSPPSGSPPGGSGGPPGGFGSPPGGFGRGPGGAAPPSGGAGWRPSPTITTPQSLPSGGTTPIPTPGASGYRSAPAPALAPPPFRPAAPVSPNWSLPTPRGVPLAAGGAGGGAAAGGAAGGAASLAVGAAAGLGLALGELGRGELAGLGYEGFEYPPNTGDLLRDPLGTLGAGLRGTLESLRDGFNPFELAGAPSPIPLPMPGGAPPFTGGQMPGVSYRITGTWRVVETHPTFGTVDSGPQPFSLSMVGPLLGIQNRPTATNNRYFFVGNGGASEALIVNPPLAAVTTISFTVRRNDNQPDTGGDPQPAPSVQPARPPRTLPFPVPDSPLSPGVSPAPAPLPSPAGDPAPSRLPVPAEPDTAPIAPPLREAPQTPGLPSTPFQPATPRVPSIPQLPTLPETPPLPQTPFSPFGPQRIGNPVIPGTAAQPGSSPIPAAPGVGVRTQLPPVTVTTLNPTAGGAIVPPPPVRPPATSSNQRPNDPCQDPCGDGIFGAISSIADLISSIIDALAGNNEQNCDVCALLEQAIALLEPEGNNTVKLYPCNAEAPEPPAPGQPAPPDPAGTKSLTWSGTGIQALIEASKATQKGIAEIWEKVRCEQDEPIVIYPNDVYSEFALEGRLTLEFTTLDAYPKQVVGNSRWSLDIPNPREEYDWATDFEPFRLTKGSWYGRCIWSESGIRSGAYCADQEEAQKLIDYIASLTTATPLRQRITSSGRTGLSTAELRIIRVVKATIENGQVIETVCYKPPTT